MRATSSENAKLASGRGGRERRPEEKDKGGGGGGGGRNRGAKSQKARNARGPRAQKNPTPDRKADAPPNASRNKERNNGRRQREGKFGRRLRQPQKGGGGDRSKNTSPNVTPKPPAHADGGPPSALRLPPTNPDEGYKSRSMNAPWNRRQDQSQHQHRGPGKPNQEAQDWGPEAPKGLTDLSRNKYSVPWLLQRRDQKLVQECNFLPPELAMKNQSAAVRARRYPFKSARPARGKNGRQEEVPAWMGDEELGKEFTFRVLDDADKEHFKKFGTVKNEKDVNVISPAAYEANEKAKLAAEKQAAEDILTKAVTHDDILQAFHTEKADNNEDFNPDTMFASQEPAAPAAPVATGPVVQIDNVDMNQDHDNFLEKFMKKPNVNVPKHGASPLPPGLQKQASSGALRPGTQPQAARGDPYDPNSLPRGPADVGRPNPASRAHGMPGIQQKPSNVSRNPSSMQQQALASNNERPTGRPKRPSTMSVNPDQLAYASRSATKAIRETLKHLGYISIVQPKKPHEATTSEEREELTYQEEIKKIYEDAILRANKIFYSHKYMRRMQNMKQPATAGGPPPRR